MAPFLDKKCPNHVVFEGLLHLFAGSQESESRFDVSLKNWKMSTKIKNGSVTNCFYATLFESKNNVFSEKLQKLGTKLELVTLRCFGLR